MAPEDIAVRPHSPADMAVAPIPVPPGVKIRDGVLVDLGLASAHEHVDVTPEAGPSSTGPVWYQQLEQNQRHYRELEEKIDHAIDYGLATGEPYVPSRRDLEVLMEARAELDKGGGRRILLGEIPPDKDKNGQEKGERELAWLPLSDKVTRLIETFTELEIWRLPAKDATELRKIRDACQSGTMTRQQADEAVGRMRRLLHMKDTHDKPGMAEVSELLESGAISRMLELDDLARASSKRPDMARRPPISPEPASAETDKAPDQDPDREPTFDEFYQESEAWLAKRLARMTPEEKKSGIFELARRFAHAQSTARGKGRGLFKDSHAFTEVRETGREFGRALARLIKSDEGLKILPDLIRKRRAAGDAEIAEKTAEQLTDEEQQALFEGLSTIADYFTAITAEELHYTHESDRFDRFFLSGMRMPKRWRRVLSVVGLSTAAVLSMLFIPGPVGWAGAAVAVAKLTGLGVGVGFLNQVMHRRVANTDEVAYKSIRDRHDLEMQSLESLMDGLVAPDGALYLDQAPDAQFDWRQLIRSRVEYSQDGMREKSARLIRDMVNGGLICYLAGVVGPAAPGAKEIAESTVAGFVVDVLGKHYAVNMALGGIAMAVGTTVASQRLGREGLMTVTDFRLEKLLASLGGYSPTGKRRAEFGIRLRYLFPRLGKIIYPIQSKEVQRWKDAAEQGVGQMTPDGFLKFVRDNEDTLFALRKALSSEHRLRDALSAEHKPDRQKYIDYMEHLVERAGVFPEENERVAKSRFLGLLGRIDTLLDREHERKVQIAAEQKAKRDHQKAKDRGERIEGYYEDERAARAARLSLNRGPSTGPRSRI